MPEKIEKFDIKKTYMSNRDIFGYMDKLEISEEELNEPNTLIVDLGSGTKQDLAKGARELGLKSKIISVDPRLGLAAEEDLALPLSNKQERNLGRKNPEPLTIAALGQALPFKSGSIDKIFTMFSVPYYLETQSEINDNLSEMLRILKDDGIIKIFPVLKEQKRQLENFLDQQKNISFLFKLKEEETDPTTGEQTEDYLLVIKKNKK